VVTGIGFLESSGQAMAFTAAATMMAQVVSPARAGAAQGLSRAAGGLSAAVISVISAPVYAAWGATTLFLGTIAATASVAALAVVLLRSSGRPVDLRGLHAHPGGTVGVSSDEHGVDGGDGVGVGRLERAAERPHVDVDTERRDRSDGFRDVRAGLAGHEGLHGELDSHGVRAPSR
jgi:hypothetical protein